MKAPTAVIVLKALRWRVDNSLVLTIGLYEMRALWAAYVVTHDPIYLKLIAYGFVSTPQITEKGAMAVLPIGNETEYTSIRTAYKALEAAKDQSFDYKMPEPAELGKLLKETLEPKKEKTESLPAELQKEFQNFDSNFEKFMKEATDPNKQN